MYSTGFTAGGPVQNTVIVQHPGQGVYVQQHVSYIHESIFLASMKAARIGANQQLILLFWLDSSLLLGFCTSG